jgi:hypothetical protein
MIRDINQECKIFYDACKYYYYNYTDYSLYLIYEITVCNEFIGDNNKNQYEYLNYFVYEQIKYYYNKISENYSMAILNKKNKLNQMYFIFLQKANKLLSLLMNEITNQNKENFYLSFKKLPNNSKILMIMIQHFIKNKLGNI